MNRPARSSPRRGSDSSVEVLFDPARTEVELYDALAEQQADQLRINSAQLRRFFGEIKDLYRQFNALTATVGDPGDRAECFRQQIEPRFKMLRSKVFYAQRPGAQGGLDRNFARFLEQGIGKVNGPDDFVKFVMHVEAVVGFMYGKDKVKR